MQNFQDFRSFDYRKLHNEDLMEYYPENFEIDTYYKRYMWQCEPILPLINFDKINRVVKKVKSNENALIPDQLSYQDIKGLSNESRQKLLEVKPRTIAHAQRIPGITPATISLLLVHLKKTQKNYNEAKSIFQNTQ